MKISVIKSDNKGKPLTREELIENLGLSGYLRDSEGGIGQRQIALDMINGVIRRIRDVPTSNLAESHLPTLPAGSKK